MSQAAVVIAAPAAINAEIEKQHELMVIGAREEAIIRSYAISLQRKTSHPAGQCNYRKSLGVAV